LLPALAYKLWAFVDFNECEQIVVEHVAPTRFRFALEHALERQRHERTSKNR
jgi:hypothetical protein